jgi:hypothetical protein
MPNTQIMQIDMLCNIIKPHSPPQGSVLPVTAGRTACMAVGQPAAAEDGRLDGTIMIPPSGSAVQLPPGSDNWKVFGSASCRNFRTFTAPTAVQFVSLAVENSGEVVVAGSQDDFQVGGGEKQGRAGQGGAGRGGGNS